EYDSRADKMEMFNRALMKKGSDEVRGHYISYNANTEFFQVTGGGTKAAAGSDGRVHAVIQPKPKDKPAAITPAPSKPAGAAATSQPAPL
ncbi:MAG: lipopolysaccharide transport periplasmic protein LptA, partial [Betaproteobacteria bacterium]|nr:lipopolysaccharide transport periplasmic protein LptA [Betaproteobacteria bacterium]